MVGPGRGAVDGGDHVGPQPGRVRFVEHRDELVLGRVRLEARPAGGVQDVQGRSVVHIDDDSPRWLPGSLGEGGFAADDFLREIQSLATRFEVVRIDGPDFLHRDATEVAPWFADPEVRERAARRAADVDDCAALRVHLATLHPIRHSALLAGVPTVALTGVGPVPDQSDALRLVVLVGRLYDGDVPVLLVVARERRRRGPPQDSASRAFSASTSNAGGGQPRSRVSKASSSSSVTARRAYHFSFAGMTYHGATSVDVLSNTAW
jgi:hypothetical protein